MRPMNALLPHHNPLWFRCQHDGNALALLNDQRSYSFRQLADEVAQLCASIERQGVSSGDPVVVISNKATAQLLLQLACLQLGAIFCPLSFHQPQSALEAMATKLGARFYWSDDHQLPGLQALTLGDGEGEGEGSFTLPAHLNGKQASSVVFTSGSSGAPKAVVHSWNNHFFSALGSNQGLSLKPGERWLLSLPLFHIGGQAILWRCLIAGAAVVTSSHNLNTQLLAKQGITHLSLVPTQLYRLLRDPGFNPTQLPLRKLLIGGASCEESLLEQAINRGFEVYSSYGSSELCSQIATRNHRIHEHYQVLPFRQAKQVNGELYLKGETLFMGYWGAQGIKRPEDGEGWFNSGDRGDVQGRDLQIFGRSSNMFISGGENIQPEEIEQVLLQHPSIEQAVVLPQPNPEYGHRPVAFVQLAAGLNYNELEAHLRQQLAGLKLPVRYYELPPLRSLKPQRQNLQKLLSRDQAQPASIEGL